MSAPGGIRPPSRRRWTTAVCRWRWLVAAALVIVLVVVAVVLGERGGGGEGSPSVREEVRAHRDAQPVRFTIAASGDLLIHSVLWERALALGGGTYDFAPLFDAIEPYVAGADLPSATSRRR